MIYNVYTSWYRYVYIRHDTCTCIMIHCTCTCMYRITCTCIWGKYPRKTPKTSEYQITPEVSGQLIFKAHRKVCFTYHIQINVKCPPQVKNTCIHVCTCSIQCTVLPIVMITTCILHSFFYLSLYSHHPSGHF